MTGNRRLPAMLFGLLLFTQVGSAEEYMIQGVVRGGAEREAVTVIGVRSRNLHRGASAVVAVAGVDSNGTFQLAWDGPASLWLMVARQPSTASLDELVRAPMVLASHAPVRGGATDVILQVPSNQMTQSLWRGDTAENTPLKYIGSIVLLVLFFLGVWLRLRSEPVGTIPTHLPNMRAGIGWLLIALLLLGMRVGSEPLDLLEYSYFHEGVRPGSATAVLNDTISAELAHGPVTPLVLRGMALMSSDPFALRLPSVCFGRYLCGLYGRLPVDCWAVFQGTWLPRWLWARRSRSFIHVMRPRMRLLACWRPYRYGWRFEPAIQSGHMVGGYALRLPTS